jgi:hypothetical protein
MKQFKKVVKEINRTLNELILFDVAVNTVLIFLSIYLFLALFNLYPVSAILPAVVYFLMATLKKVNVNKMKTVESKYTALREKLRTAADNIELENPVVNELQEEVIRDIKKVGISSFLNPKNLSYRIFACILLAFTIVFVSTLHLSFLDLENLLKEAPGLLEDSLSRFGSAADFSDVNLTEDIYGEKEIAILGNEEINIKIRPANFKVNVKEGGKVEEKKFDEIAAADVFIESAEVFEENVPVEEQELVRAYFRKITG